MHGIVARDQEGLAMQASHEVAEVLAAVFKPGEVDRWWIDDALSIAWSNKGEEWLHVRAQGELFSAIFRSPDFSESGENRKERLVDELKTWISTTSFGWGEVR